MNTAERTTVERPSKPTRRRRSLFPRFGLRGLLIFALLFCLFFAWIGRGFIRVRQEDAAIETILRAGGSIYTENDGGIDGPPGALSEPSALPMFERAGDLALRSIGWRKRPAIAQVWLRTDDAGDPLADEATAALAVLPEIRIVSLTGPAFNDASLLALDRLPRLECIHLVRTLATPEGLTKIAAPERIEYLYVEGHGYLDFISSAGALRSLRGVDLVDVLIVPNDVAALASLPELKELRMSRISVVGEKALTPIAGAKKLRSLEISLPAGASHDPDDLRAIASLPSLERLRIDVADADLPLFVGATKLRYLGPYGRVSEEAGRAFSLAHPECVIRVAGQRRAGLYLLNGEPTERPASEPTY